MNEDQYEESSWASIGEAPSFGSEEDYAIDSGDDGSHDSDDESTVVRGSEADVVQYARVCLV